MRIHKLVKRRVLKRGEIMAEKIKDAILAKLSERLEEDKVERLSPETNNAKLNCWACGKYDGDAEKCYQCNQCNLWTLKKIFLHNRRYLRYLEGSMLRRMGFGAQL
jgi:flagellar biosynthesis/type III secretory pathway chaperone